MPKNQMLEKIYREVKLVILSRQHPVTGLLPASTAVNNHGDYTDAWVRDNVYSIIAPWALCLAFKRSGDAIRGDELEQATIKLMRGLLQSMMRQADKVETFKHTLDPADSLHAKYDTATGLTVVADDAWGHLQLDATSLFLLMLAQMSASGLRIILTYDEVDFVQNLTYYIASAYRTADYGIWERGNKINNGKPEINASSLGMAKAALQALDGFNLFGPNASERAIVHTVTDAISLARISLGSLLPRESLSKEVDSALLSVIGFPAFAVGNEELVNETRDQILKKLGGNYGLKRFLWDGHQTELEDHNRLHYEHSELAGFEHIESEWPLFYCYLYINALFRGNPATAKHYRKKIERLMVERDGVSLIPELFYLEREHIAEEKRNPRSQPRVPNENLPLVWAQSLYYTALLIDEGFIDAANLDRVKLRQRTTKFNRSQVALVVLAESDQVKQKLAANGVIAESIGDIFPLKVISAPHLVEAYAKVGANQALGLSGRPRRRLQSLATSQTYKINGNRFLCLSWIQSGAEDYRMHDARLVSRLVKKEIDHIRKHWLNRDVAVFTFMMTDKLCESADAKVLYNCLRNYQLRTEDENIGYASANLAYLASRENRLFAPDICITPIQEEERRELADTSEWDEFAANFIKALGKSEMENCAALSDIATKYPLKYPISAKNSHLSMKHLFEQVYEFGYVQGQWRLARLAFVLLGRGHTDLADYLSVLSAGHFTIIVGADKNHEFGLPGHLSNQQIVETLREASSSGVELCLLQEIFEAVGVLHRTKPRVFEGLRSIHLHNLLRLCGKHAAPKTDADLIEAVSVIGPDAILEAIENILTSQRSIFSMQKRKQFSIADSALRRGSGDGDDAIDIDWFEWRSERGVVLSLEREFLEKIWQSLGHANYLIIGDASNQQCVIDCALVRSSMTSGEEIFARLVDDSLSHIHPPYFKSAVVEALLAFTLFCDAYPKVMFTAALNLGDIVERAAKEFCAKEKNETPGLRNIDQFLEEAPDVLAQFYAEVYRELAEAELPAA
ncbi:glycoside hydrolase family 15 protein [Teredinibacter waterburyi]|uniref:glycoside hydrolase family 15 protein n=1 Tax=Teredinibacter waterburyi TaxID=1500538 RepID=UPI00165EFABB|nr:glycoside hydrolase family 15 protein [Teredinibacter waterburyi]